MTWQPTKTQLEDAAIACGLSVTFVNTPNEGWWFSHVDKDGLLQRWLPHFTTARGKADLLDLMLATSISWEDGTDYMYADRFGDFPKKVKITNGDKHAALMEAALEVAAQVGAKMKGTPC